MAFLLIVMSGVLVAAVLVVFGPSHSDCPRNRLLPTHSFAFHSLYLFFVRSLSWVRHSWEAMCALAHAAAARASPSAICWQRSVVCCYWGCWGAWGSWNPAAPREGTAASVTFANWGWPLPDMNLLTSEFRLSAIHGRHWMPFHLARLATTEQILQVTVGFSICCRRSRNGFFMTRSE